MPIETLRVAAFVSYLGSWLVLVITAVVGALPQFRRHSVTAFQPRLPVIAGTFLQSIAALGIALTLDDGPLRPSTFELAAALLLAPLSASIFAWAQRSTPKYSEQETLVTSGPYQWVRHPIYLAFFAMLLATGFLASSGLKLLVASVLYLAGSEIRIAIEEADLNHQFPESYSNYKKHTPWRYLPGIR